jgi:hypothetical protein
MLFDSVPGHHILKHLREPKIPVVPLLSQFRFQFTSSLVAADAANGKTLWSFQTNHSWHTSPMTYMFDRKEYIAVATGNSIISFGLLE